MTRGVERRATIDTETVKGLLLINGGGAVALLAFLPTVLRESGYETLTRSVLGGLLLFQLGLVSAIIHNRLRRKCSLLYENAWAQGRQPDRCVFLGRTLAEPCICMRSITCMWLSIASFLGAGALVVFGALCVL
jgi:hypothetical protein